MRSKPYYKQRSTQVFRCQVGACAMCMCRKQQGKISYELEPMLTPQEQAQGWIFACLARVESDLVLSLD